MSFPPYASYKDTDVAWLGAVPSSWEIKRLRFVATLNPSKNEVADLEDDTELSFLPMEAIGERGELDLLKTRAVGEVRNGYSYFADGDVVFAKVTPCLENGKGALMRGLIGGRGFGTTELTVLRPTETHDGRFLWWLTTAPEFRGPASGEMIGAGGLKRVPDQFVADFAAPWPSATERRAIADFLDRETAKIDALVEAQRRLIALLKEKRQAVIFHAVTKGLDPSAPLKPSGIPWLGDVPAHWDVKKLRSLARLESGHTPSRQRPEYWVEEECVIPWFTLADVGALRSGEMMEVADTSQRISELGMANSAARLLPPGTVILSRTASVGFSAITSIPLAVSQDFAAWICGPELRPSYLLLVLRAMNLEFQRLMMGSTHQTIYMPDIEAFRIPLPSLAEQDAIIAAASRKKAAVESLTREALASEALLTERRAALISAAVTGKIDVRGWTAEQVRNGVGAEIVHLHARDRTFGRVQNQKLLFLAQNYAGIEEIGGRFQRKAAGPHDADLMASIERALTAEGVMQVAQPGGLGSQVLYAVAAGTRPDHARLRAMLGDRRLAKLNHLLEVLADEDTRGVEAVATLYGVWNDALMDGETPDDERLIRGFMDWHPEKASKFKADDVRNRIGFMRRNGLVPEGRGSRTQVGALL